MPSLSGYLRANDHDEIWLDSLNRADNVQWMIDRDGVSITLIRDGTPQTAQNALLVPIASGARGNESRHETGESSSLDMLLIGVRGHGTETDFDVKRGDVFTLNTVRYEVIDVNKAITGKTEANVKARM